MRIDNSKLFHLCEKIATNLHMYFGIAGRNVLQQTMVCQKRLVHLLNTMRLKIAERKSMDALAVVSFIKVLLLHQQCFFHVSWFTSRFIASFQLSDQEMAKIIVQARGYLQSLQRLRQTNVGNRPYANARKFFSFNHLNGTCRIGHQESYSLFCMRVETLSDWKCAHIFFTRICLPNSSMRHCSVSNGILSDTTSGEAFACVVDLWLNEKDSTGNLILKTMSLQITTI